MKTYEEKLSEIKLECEAFQQQITRRLDDLVYEQKSYLIASNLSRVVLRLNQFIEQLNENE